jgi:hypothetical protein
MVSETWVDQACVDPVRPMFLNHRDENSLVEVLNLTQLFDPFSESVEARLHAGEEL